ncbi:MAG: hypothetical protein ACRDI2_18805, partial [Chloroflexota bacterium]
MSRLLIHRRRNRQPPSRVSWLVMLAATAFLFTSLAACSTILAGGIGTVYAYQHITRDLPNPNDLATRPLAQVTQLYDRTGQHLLYEFYEERR